MATHDYVIDNSTGANVRADINSVLQAILTNNSSSSAPSTTAAYMFWADTTSGTLKIRNSSDNAWVELLQLDGTLTLEDGSSSTPGLAFRDDLDTGIFSSAADTFNVATGGVERMELGATTIFNESGANVDFRIEGDTEANLFYVDASTDRIGIGLTSPDRHFTVNASATTRMNIKSGSSSTAGIEFGDSDDFNAGFIVYDNSDNSFQFGVNGAGEKVRIASNGGLCVNSTSADNNVHIGITSSSSGIILKAAGDHHSLIDANSNRSGAGNTLHRYLGRWNGTQVAQMAFITGGDTTNKDDGHITFATSSADNLTERMRIDSSGNLIVGGTSAQASDAATLMADGEVTAPGFYFSNNQGSAMNSDGIRRATTNTMVFDTNSTERMRIDSNGSVGIGETSPGRKLHLTGGTFPALRIENSSTSIANGTNICGLEFAHADSSAAGVCAGITAQMADTSQGGLHMLFLTGTNVNLYRENMRIASDGDVFVGCTSSPSASVSGFSIEDNGGKCMVSHGTNFSGLNNMIRFFNPNGNVGNVQTNNLSTLYNTSGSDRALKKNFETWDEDILSIFKNINPQKFNFLSEDDSAEKTKGFVAQDLVDYFPEAYPKNPDTKKYWFNPSGMVVYLMKAIQELEAKVAALEAA